MINLDGLNDDDKVNIVTHGGNIYKDWFVYNAKCGYFTKTKGSMVDGMLYAESIKSLKVVNNGNYLSTDTMPT